MAGASTIKEFLVGLGFDVDEIGLSKFTGAIASATGVAVALGAAVTAAAGAVLAGVKDVAQEYDALDKLATRFRTTVDAVDEFKDVAQVLGLSAAQSDLTSFDRALVDTSIGLGRAKKVFEEIGITVTDSAGKLRPTIEVFDELGAKLSTMERGKQIVIMERLGLDPALLKIINSDLSAIKADLAAIDAATGFDLGDAVEQSKGFMKAWRAMQQEWQKVTIVISKLYESIAVRLMPALRAAIDDFRKRLEAFRKMLMANFDGLRRVIGAAVKFIVDVFGGMWQLLGRVFDLLVEAVMFVIRTFNSFDATLWAITAAVAGLYAAWLLLNSGILASPVFQVIALAAALLLLWDDYQTWKEGGKSLIAWQEWEGEIEAVKGFVSSFIDVLRNGFNILFATVDFLVRLLRGDFAGAWRAVGEAVESIVNIFKIAFQWITNLIDAVARFGGASGSVTSRLSTNLKAAADAQFATGQFDAMGNPLGGSLAGDVGQSVQQSVTQETNIVVQGGADPGATGRAVAGEQGRVNADMTRNLKGSAR